MAGEPEQRRQRDTIPTERSGHPSTNVNQMAGAAVALEGHRQAVSATRPVAFEGSAASCAPPSGLRAGVGI